MNAVLRTLGVATGTGLQLGPVGFEPTTNGL